MSCQKKCLNVYFEIEQTQSPAVAIQTPTRDQKVWSKFCNRITRGKALQRPFANDDNEETGTFTQRTIESQ